MAPGKHFLSFSKPLLLVYSVLGPSWALGESSTEHGRPRSALVEIDLKEPRSHLCKGSARLKLLLLWIRLNEIVKGRWET